MKKISDWGLSLEGLDGQSLLFESELIAILELIPESGKYLEIGTWDGVSTSFMSSSRPNVHFTCLDIFDCKDCIQNWVANKTDNMYLFVGTAQQFEGICRPAYYDIVFVDGSHEEHQVYPDLVSASKLVAENGKIIVHDYFVDHDEKPGSFPGVVAAIDRFCNENNMRVKKLARSTGIICDI